MTDSADLPTPGDGGVLRTASLAALGFGLAAGAAAMKIAASAARAASEIVDQAPGADAVREALGPWAERGVEERDAAIAAAQRLIGAIADAVVGSVDVDAIVNRLDLDSIVSTVDIDSIAKRLEVTDLVFHTTGGIAGDAVDFVRGRGVAVDRLVMRIADRILRREEESEPALVTREEAHEIAAAVNADAQEAAPARDNTAW